MPYSPIAVANQFIERHGAAGQIDHLKLQKLTYFADGWWLATNGAPLLTVRPQVWRYGPVYPALYGACAGHGRAPITQPIGGGPFGQEPPRVVGEEAEQVAALVDWTWDNYGSFNGIVLSDMTHAPGTPWRTIAEHNNFVVPDGTVIDAQQDWQYFAALAQQRGWPTAPFQAA